MAYKASQIINGDIKEDQKIEILTLFYCCKLRTFNFKSICLGRITVILQVFKFINQEMTLQDSKTKMILFHKL